MKRKRIIFGFIFALILVFACTISVYAGDIKVGDSCSFKVNDNIVVFDSLSNEGTVSLTNGQLTVRGNWIDNGTFFCGTSLVTFEGLNQRYAGNSSFYNFTKISTTADVLEILPGSAINIIPGGKIILRGQPSNKLTLTSASPGGWWFLRSLGTEEVRYVRVSSSDASGFNQIISYNSSPIGGTAATVNWLWSGPVIDLKTYLAGFYLGSGSQRLTDVTVYLTQGDNPALTNLVAKKDVTLSNAGTAEVDFSNTDATQGDYYVAVFHKVATNEGSNHLALITANQHYLDANPTLIDLTTFGSAYGVEPQAAEVGGTYSMRAGDADGDGRVTIDDIGLVLNNYSRQGTTVDIKMVDMNGDTLVTIDDLGLLLNSYSRETQFKVQ